MPKPILGYWRVRGLGQPIRYLLAYLKIDYENKMYEFGDGLEPPFGSEEWIRDKMTLGLKFPNLPYCIDGDFKLTQSYAIIRHIARTSDLAASLLPPDKEAELDMLEGSILDMWFSLSSLVYGYKKELEAPYDERQDKKLKELSDYLGGNKWLLGDKISYVDFILYEFLHKQERYKAESLEKFPNLVALLRNFEAIPEISKFRNSADYVHSPTHGPSAKLKL